MSYLNLSSMSLSLGLLLTISVLSQQLEAQEPIPSGFPKSTKFAPEKDASSSASQDTKTPTDAKPVADGTNRFPPGGFTANVFPTPPLSADAKLPVNPPPHHGNVNHFYPNRPFGTPSPPPVYLPNYNPYRPYGVPYGYGYPGYVWGYRNGWGYGHGVLKPGIIRTPAGGSHYFGNPHASQYFGNPHASQGSAR